MNAPACESRGIVISKIDTVSTVFCMNSVVAACYAVSDKQSADLIDCGRHSPCEHGGIYGGEQSPTP